MKKIITLMVAVLLVATSFAQYNSGNQRNHHDNDVAYNDGKYKDRNYDERNDRSHYNRERDMQIERINREYDRKIESVRHRWFMSHSKKQELIYSLENKRRYEIRMVYNKFNNRNDRFDDHDSRRHW